MQALKLDRTGLNQPEQKAVVAVLGPDAAQAAAYIQDMTMSMRGLAVRHNMATLALLLEMASVEAATSRKPHA